VRYGISMSQALAEAMPAATANPLVIRAFWDEETSVWVAESADIVGLITEAKTLEALSEKLKHLIPELLELNRVTTTN
jgi:predicted RNase H-like HicB family nuclease